MITIYKITNPKGMGYVGQTKNITKRKHLYKHRNCKKQPMLYNSICKYGYENHIFEILDEVLEEEGDQAEIYYIELHNTYYLAGRGMNLTLGGRTSQHSPQTKAKLSAAILGSKNVKAKKLYQYNLTGQFIKEWDCMKCIEREFNINSSSLSQALKRGNYCKGYLWSYSKEHSLPNHILTPSQKRYLL